MSGRLSWPGVLLFAPLLVASVLEGRTWSAITTDHFEIYTKTTGGDKIIKQLEQFRAELRGTGLLNSAKERIVHVLLFDNENEYFRYAPPGSIGFFQSCRDYDFVGLLSTDPDVVGHEYVHAVTSWIWPHAPAWIQEGLAEFYSTAKISRRGVKLGGLKWEYADVIDRLSAQRLPELATARSGLIRADRSETSELYGLAWGTVSLLQTAAAYRAGCDRFLTMLSNGTGLPEALSKVYGVSLDQFVKDVDHYLRSGHFPYTEFRSPVMQNMRAIHLSTSEAENRAARNLEMVAFLNSQSSSIFQH
jgi:hypothetical protein